MARVGQQRHRGKKVSGRFPSLKFHTLHCRRRHFVRCFYCNLYRTKILSSLQDVTAFRVLSCYFVNFAGFSITCGHSCLFVSVPTDIIRCVLKLKESKIIFGFRQIQLYFLTIKPTRRANFSTLFLE